MTMISTEEKLKQLLLKCAANGSDAQSTVATTKSEAATFRLWFLQQFQTEIATSSTTTTTTESNTDTGKIALEDFAVYFLNALRHHVEPHLRTNDNETSRIQTPVRNPKSVTTQRQSRRGGDGNTDALTPRRLPMAAIDMSVSLSDADESLQVQLDDSLLHSNCSLSIQSNTSTPVRRLNSSASSNQIHQRRSDANSTSHPCNSTPNSSHDWGNRSAGGSSGGVGGSAGRCLGDFILLNATPGNNRSQRHKKTTPASETPTGQRKKRVVPTTIIRRSTSENDASPFGGGSSFSQENNILKIAHTEVEDKSKCTILEARKTLKQQLFGNEISKELKAADAALATNAVVLSDIVDVPAVDDELIQQTQVDLTNVTHRNIVDALACIYATLIDLNLVTNVLNEISFILNLLNAPTSTSSPDISTSRLDTKIDNMKLEETDEMGKNSIAETIALDALDNVTNCVYFAMRVLDWQQLTLKLLDLKSLGVLLQNDRLCKLAPELHTQLSAMHQQKQQLEAKQLQTPSTTATSMPFDKSCQNVHFQAENDSREHFSSNNEFGAFKTQRDLFYKGLKQWETNHLNPLWNFANELRPLIADIFKQSENPVNMAHFAKLFVAQLLISASDATSPEEIGLETATVDQQKLSKLTQRLVAPSNFSVDYQFPRSQAFFRDFIVQARSVAFVEQLKMALYSQVVILNESSFEQLNVRSGMRTISTADDADDDEPVIGRSAQQELISQQELVVRPDVLASMLLLAKFLGFVTALPFSNVDSILRSGVEKKQIWLRSHFQPNFDVCRLLDEAMRAGKLLITLPWLVQYLAMLDNATLKLDHFVQVTQRLFALYGQLNYNTASSLLATTTFVLRCCLGWFFEEKPFISEQYYSYRAANFNTGAIIASLNACENSNAVALSPSPLLESLLIVACPFLAEFRVAIMPAKHAQTKYVSRTGRYRYITLSSVTNVANIAAIKDSPAPEFGHLSSSSKQIESAEQKAQAKLIEAFLHGQNASMRRLIDFITERTYKSVVKDGQLQILLPSKTAADSRVNEISSYQKREVVQAVSTIYQEAAQTALNKWHATMPQLIDERCKNALDALLPADTTPIIKHTYKQLICRNAMQKVQQWTYTNMIKSQDFYCSNIYEMAQKICKANAKEPIDATQSSDLLLVKETPSISDIIDDMQHWLHCTSLRPELCVELPAPLIDLFERVLLAIEGNTLPTMFFRLICGGIIQLMQHMIANMPQLISDELLQIVCRVLLAPAMLKANEKPIKTIHRQSTEINNTVKSDDQKEDQQNDESNIQTAEFSPNPYNALITISFMSTLGTRRMCYDKLSALLIALICQHIITVDFVNVLFVPIFKEDWHPQTLNEMSLMLRQVANATASVRSQHKAGSNKNNNSNNDSDRPEEASEPLELPELNEEDGKSHLFMEVLADFSRDVDEF